MSTSPIKDKKSLAVKGDIKLLKALAEQWKENGIEGPNPDKFNDKDRINYLHACYKHKTFYWAGYNNTRAPEYSLPKDWDQLKDMSPLKRFKLGQWVTEKNNRDGRAYKIIDHVSLDGFVLSKDFINKRATNFRFSTEDEILKSLKIEFHYRFNPNKDRVYVLDRPGDTDCLIPNCFNLIETEEGYALKNGSALVYKDGKWAKKVEEPTGPRVLINNYVPEYSENYVKWGCVEIHKDVFHALAGAHEVSHSRHDEHYNKIVVNQVKIGKGNFDMEDIIKISNYYKKLDS